MADLHPVSSKVADELTLLEHGARDIITTAKAMEALISLHQGRVIVGITPVLYRETLKGLVDAARSNPK